ncbi:hypothetical protein [Kitasatospora viridis]|uniref:Uncharacterized protein n=1 Tax=Kitasatospora viridis TaxID=281105 RepID=A0A561UKN1_9ACTN|nr:hypothetical protein [Kitasatospora viridis]TWF99917.1 hypothetical protein FHX73_113777 [Kitasatospora viridis]
MAQFIVSHPAGAAFSGTIVGSTFTAGTAHIDTDTPGGQAAYAYFQRAQYGLTPYQAPPEEAIERIGLDAPPLPDTDPEQPHSPTGPEQPAILGPAEPDQEGGAQ